MSDDFKRDRQNRGSKYSRKNRKISRRSNTSNDVNSQLPHRIENSSDQTSTNADNDILNVMIGDFTSDIDDPRVSTPSTILSTTNYNDKSDSNNRRKSVGEYRRDQLTKHIKTLYQDWFEFDQNSAIQDTIASTEKRKQYFTTLW